MERPIYLLSEFIKSDEKGNYVQIMKGNKKEKAYVTIGLETESDTEIVKGLNEGDIIYD